MIDINIVKDVLALFLQFANLVIIIYGGYKFLNKPHDTLSEEIVKIKQVQAEQDLKIKEVQQKIQDEIDYNVKKNREQDKTNKVFKKVFILLANFEVAFCQHTGYEHTEDLIKAQEELNEYLAGE